MVPNKLKTVIFKHIYKALSNVEIIHYKDSVFFIDREEKCWYFEYEKKRGTLWWRHLFFSSFFNIFSLSEHEYEDIMSEWIEEVLNCNINSISYLPELVLDGMIESVLNYEVIKIVPNHQSIQHKVDNIEISGLNYKVGLIFAYLYPSTNQVEKILNYKVMRALPHNLDTPKINEVLNDVQMIH